MDIKIYNCKRCNHEWANRNGREPIICPRCKSAYWNREKRNGQEATQETEQNQITTLPQL
jgi:DNA-directed RNA polymerase subunit RPC12/RpoP